MSKKPTKKAVAEKVKIKQVTPKRKKGSAHKTPSKKPIHAENAQESSAKTLLFYSKPVPLNTEHHRDLRLRQTPPRVFDFVKETNSIPVAGQEFFDACRYYPIVFTGTGDDMIASALLGLRNDENLMVDAAGHWATGYVPIFVRRYPFLLGERPDSEGHIVLIDEDYVGFTQNADDPALFGADGAETEILVRAKAFLERYQVQVAHTRTFIERLQTFDLLVDRIIRGTTAAGEGYALHGFRIVDETRLRALSDARLRKLFSTDELAWLYAHLISLRNTHELAQRLDQRLQILQDVGKSKPKGKAKSVD